MKLPIYLDYAATTPVAPEVIQAMHQCLGFEGMFANSGSSAHTYGNSVANLINQARQDIANSLNAQANEIIFTSGATEANNLAIKGVIDAYKNLGNHIITSQIEHKSVLDTCKYLEKNGIEVTYLKPNQNGHISPNAVENAIKSNTILISIMHVNNEIGSIQNIEAIAKIAKNYKLIVHTDAVQSFGKIPLDVNALGVDLLSISSHKIYGPKGIGALYVRKQGRKIRLEPQIHGGAQEFGMRSGTLPTQLIAGFAMASKLASIKMQEDAVRISNLKNILWEELKSIPGVTLNGSFENRIYNNLNISVAGVEGEALLAMLHDLAITHSSACNTQTQEVSYVLQALDMPQSLVHASFRISLGRHNTTEEIIYIGNFIKKQILKLRAMTAT